MDDCGRLEVAVRTGDGRLDSAREIWSVVMVAMAGLVGVLDNADDLPVTPSSGCSVGDGDGESPFRMGL